MRSYHIELGYNGGGTDAEEAIRWEILKREARNIADTPEAIIAEARRCGSPETCSDRCCHLNTFADNYRDPFTTRGHPISIIEDAQQIIQLACGDGSLKFHVRRAYIRLLIEAAHKHGIEVNLTVT